MKTEVDVGALERLLTGLKEAGVETGSRNRTVAEKTGYSEKTVSNILSGNARLTPRFITVSCRTFRISEFWVETGHATETDYLFSLVSDEGEIINPSEPKRNPYNIKFSDPIPDHILQDPDRAARTAELMLVELLTVAGRDVACIEALRVLLDMSEGDRWRAVAMLKEMNGTAK